MQKENEKLKNDKAIFDQIQIIKDSYEVDKVDVIEEEMSFLDHLNRLCQLILNDNLFSAYHVLDKQSLTQWHNKRFSRWIKKFIFTNTKNIFYLMLLVTITGFLISEALSFYSIDGVITTKTYIKAILTEVCFIFLNGYRSSGILQGIWVNFLRGGIFTLMMLVISSQSLMVGTGKISENAAIQQQIILIEGQIKEKDKELDYYSKKDWPKNFTRTTIEKQNLVDKLIILKEKQEGGKNEEISKIELYKMYGRAAFRILLLFISILITRRIFTF